MRTPVRSSPVAALGALVALLAIGTLGRPAHRTTPAAPRPAAPPATHVDLNTADAHALESLPRIGPALAQRILAHRRQHGPFRAVEELEDVPGIGAATVEAVRGRVTISTRESDVHALPAPEPPR